MAEMSAQQRAAAVTVRLMRGGRLTNDDVVRLCGYADKSAAWRLMMHLAAMHEHMPLTFSHGVWYIPASGCVGGNDIVVR